MQNILIIEDEKLLSDALKKFLERSNYSVTVMNDGKSGLECASSGDFNVIVLDIMLPEMDGFQVLKALREKKINTPVLMLTARIQIDDKVNAFAFGADDYLTKPFEVRELLARVNALLRRGHANALPQDEICFGDLRVQPSLMTISCGENSESLAKKEIDLLQLFLENPKQVITREQILHRVWGYESEIEYNSAEVYISFLRKKLAAISSSVGIKVVRSVGYILSENEEKHIGGIPFFSKKK